MSFTNNFDLKAATRKEKIEKNVIFFSQIYLREFAKFSILLDMSLVKRKNYYLNSFRYSKKKDHLSMILISPDFDLKFQFSLIQFLLLPNVIQSNIHINRTYGRILSSRFISHAPTKKICSHISRPIFFFSLIRAIHLIYRLCLIFMVEMISAFNGYLIILYFIYWIFETQERFL